MSTWVCSYKLCCCLYPLRKGLQIWGYMNLIRYCLLDGISSTVTANRIRFYFLHNYEEYEDILSISLMFVFTFLWSVANLIFNILFVVGIHNNDERKIRPHYYFWLAKVILYAIFIVAANILGLESHEIGLWLVRHVDPVSYYLAVESPVVGACDIVVQVYFIVLVRNLYKSLDKGDQRRIVDSFDCEADSQRNRPVSFQPVRRSNSGHVMDDQHRYSSRF